MSVDLLLVDGKHLLWRAADSHAELHVEMADGTKVETGAIYGFLRVLCRVHEAFKPLMTVICWDDWDVGPAARREMYAGYKQRDKAPPKMQDLIVSMVKQQHQLMEIMDLMGMWQAYSPRWEADDVMGALAKKNKDCAGGVYIYTGDRDLYQMVSERVRVVRPGKDGQFLYVGPEEVFQEYGVYPEKFIECKALAGDTGDKIPGARGIGKSTAPQILAVYPDAMSAVKVAKLGPENWAKYAKPLTESVRKRLADSEELVRVSHRLSTINCAIPIKWRPRKRDPQRVQSLLLRLKFKSLFQDGRLNRLMEMGG